MSHPDEKTGCGSSRCRGRTPVRLTFLPRNSPMNTKCLKPMLGTVLATTLLGGCSNTKESFGPQLLTKEDIISLYNVPVEQHPFQKWEWSFAREQYIRFVVERAEPGSNRWQIVDSIPYNLPLTTAVIIFRLDDQPMNAGRAPAWMLNLRLGGSDGIRVGWSGSELPLPLPHEHWTMFTRSKDPARLCVIETKGCRVRFCVEKADTRFPMKLGPWPANAAL